MKLLVIPMGCHKSLFHWKILAPTGKISLNPELLNIAISEALGARLIFWPAKSQKTRVEYLSLPLEIPSCLILRISLVPRIQHA